MKYGVFVSFYRKLTFSVKRRLTPLDVEPKVNFFKTRKKLYTILLCVTDTEYGPHDHEIRSFGQFCRKFVFFW
jgi:hypothetical protein